MNMRHDAFARFARWTARTVGHTSAFAAALGLIVVWAAMGPYFHYSDTWQLVDGERLSERRSDL